MNSPTNPAALPESPPPARIWPMYRAVVGVGVACALVIVMVYEFTRPVIERQSRRLRKQAVEEVLPGAVDSRPFQQLGDGSFAPVSGAETDPGNLVFAAYGKSGELVGLALAAEAMGYQDTIELIFGYAPDSESITGIKILKSRETPGLGDRIESDSQFLSNFERLDVRLNPAGDRLAHPIEFVKPGEKEAGWQIDGISGATISSQAVASMLADGAQRWIPAIARRKQDFLKDRKDE